jgi:hypothetical protein
VTLVPLAFLVLAVRCSAESHRACHCLAYIAVFMLDVISTNARRGHLLKTGATCQWGLGRDGSLIMDFSQECFYLATLEDASWLNNILIA